jgi:L-lactate dehydrogenase complex protein LldG
MDRAHGAQKLGVTGDQAAHLPPRRQRHHGRAVRMGETARELSLAAGSGRVAQTPRLARASRAHISCALETRVEEAAHRSGDAKMSGETNSKRAAVLGAIRKGLSARGDEPGRRGAVRVRLERSPDGLIPERARLPRQELLAQFRARLEAQTATVYEVDAAEEVPQTVAMLLREAELPPRVCCGVDAMIAALPWDEAGIVCETGPQARSTCEVGMTRALAAAAETGTLYCASGQENPVDLAFLPRLHVVIVRESAIVGSYEEAWRVFRAVFEGGSLPRTVVQVSGPSCTADIEQTLIRGAHGPVRLAIVVIR